MKGQTYGLSGAPRRRPVRFTATHRTVSGELFGGCRADKISVPKPTKKSVNFLAENYEVAAAFNQTREPRRGGEHSLHVRGRS